MATCPLLLLLLSELAASRIARAKREAGSVPTPVSRRPGGESRLAYGRNHPTIQSFKGYIIKPERHMSDRERTMTEATERKMAAIKAKMSGMPTAQRKQVEAMLAGMSI